MQAKSYEERAAAYAQTSKPIHAGRRGYGGMFSCGSRIFRLGIPLFGFVLLVGIGIASSAFLATPSNGPSQGSQEREKPDEQQVRELTAQQLELLEDGSDANGVSLDLISLSDFDTISAITDERWGGASFSASVVSRCLSEGYPIAADRSGIVECSIEVKRRGSIVRGEVLIIDDKGVEQGVLPFVFDKVDSDLLFDPIAEA